MVTVRRPRTATAWWRSHQPAVAAAVAEAEAASGHQIVVVVRRLGSSPARSADRIAQRFPGATVVFCVDPVGKTFELRWAPVGDLPASVVDDICVALSQSRLADAVGLVGRYVPRRDPGTVDLPDIVDEES